MGFSKTYLEALPTDFARHLDMQCLHCLAVPLGLANFLRDPGPLTGRAQFWKEYKDRRFQFSESGGFSTSFLNGFS